MIDENIYEGQFKNEKFHGKGKITYIRDEFSFECIFQEGFAS